MREIYEGKNGLISRAEWQGLIEELRGESERGETINEQHPAERVIRKDLNKAVLNRAKKENAVLFSGGIDSTIIAYILKTNNRKLSCYTIGLKDSPDIKYAKIISNEYNLPTTIKEVRTDEVIKAVEEVKKIFKTDNKVEISIATTEYLALSLINESEKKSVFTGLGSEEIFAGYQRHLKAKEENKDINETCWKGLRTMYDKDLIREYKLSRFFHTNEKTPFMDRQLIIDAMRISGDLKIIGNIKKFVLRQAAGIIGISRDYTMRPKKAAQYGSRVNKIVMKYLKE